MTTTGTKLAENLAQAIVVGTGTQLGAKYGAPLVEYAAKATAAKTAEVIADHGNAISYGAIGAMMGSLTLNPAVAVGATAAGAALGNLQDEEGQCVVM